MSDPVILPLTYGFQQMVFPHEGGGKISGVSREWLATENIAMWQVTADEVEEVAVLSFKDGASFTLLRHEGKLFRPVFAPESHVPCDAAMFEEACRGEQAWLDDPFAERYSSSEVQTNRPVKPNLVGKHQPDPENWRKLGESKRDKRREQVNDIAAKLLVVDGIVHRPCEEPVLVLKSPVDRSYAKPTALSLEWSMDRLESDDDAVSGPTTVKFPQSNVHERTNKKDEPVIGPRADWKGHPWRVFGLGETIEATRFAQAYAEAAGIAFEADPNLVTVIRDWHLSPGPRPDTATMAKAAYQHVSGHVRKLTRDSVMDWLDARDAQVAGDSMRTLDLVGSILTRPTDRALMTWTGSTSLLTTSGYSYSSTVSRDSHDDMADVVRYQTVERDRLLADTIDEADVAAFAEIEGPEDAGPRM